MLWTFHNGTCVSAETFEDALEKLSKISPKQFWASETHEGNWDVQLSDSVVHYEIKADTVMEAVKNARWYTHLDNSFKTLRSVRKSNEFGVGETYQE